MPAANKLLEKKGAEGSNSTLVILLYICASIELTVFKCPFFGNTWSLAVMLRTTVKTGRNYFEDFFKSFKPQSDILSIIGNKV